MMISELTIGQGNVNVEGTITNIGETRSFVKFGKQLTVSNAILTDESGSIKLTLWNDDVIRFKEGDKIKIINGYVGEFQGEKQLTSGKFGSIEKLDGMQQQTLDDSEETETESEQSKDLVTDEQIESSEGIEENGNTDFDKIDQE